MSVQFSGKRAVANVAQPAPKKILIAGQSNGVSAGRGSILSTFSTTQKVRVKSLVNNEPSPFIPTANQPATYNVAWVFLGDAYDRPIHFYNVAIGGTTVAQWDASLYLEINRELTVQNFDAVIWIQGENDYEAGTTAVAYAASLTSVINKSRVLQPALKWYVALNSNGPGGNGTRTGQQNVITAGTALAAPDLDALRLTTDTDAGSVHFQGDGLRVLGLSFLSIIQSL